MKGIKIVLAIILMGLFVTAGTFGLLELNSVVGYSLLIGSGSLLSALIVGMIVLGVILARKYNKRNFKAVMEDLVDKYDSGLINFETATNQLSKVYRITICYLVLLVLINLLFMTSLIWYLIVANREAAWFLIVPVYILFGLLIGYIKDDNKNFGYYLNKNVYQVIYSILNEVTDTLNVKEKILLYVINDNNASIIYSGGIYRISIGILLLMSLNKDELKSVIYHEIGHLIYKDSITHSSRHRLLGQLGKVIELSGLFMLTAVVITPIFTYATTGFNINEVVISKKTEERADQVVKNVKLNKEYISVGIKMKYLEYFLNQPLLKVNICVNEQPSDSYFNDLLAEFIDTLSVNENKYQQYIKSEIETKRASHPVLRSRMEVMEIEGFNYFPFGSYDDEVNKILAVFNEINDAGKNEYRQNREKYYLRQLKIIEEYQKDQVIDEIKMLDYAFAYYHIGQIDESCQAFGETLKHFPNCARALNALGYLKMYQYDDASGIDDMYRSAELNHNCVESLFQIGDFTIKMGLTEEYEIFKKRILDFQQGIFNINYDTLHIIDDQTKLKTTSLSDDIKEAIIAIGKEHQFKQLMVVKKIVNKDFSADLVCVLIDKKSLDVDDGLNEIFKILDVQTEQYAIHILNPISLKKAKKVAKPFYKREK